MSLHDINDNITLSDTTPLENQVAGHTSTVNGKKKSHGLLSHKNGYVLKSLINDDRGVREAAFYEELRTTVEPKARELLKFVPAYHGIVETDMDGEQTKWLVLEDAARGMAMPCIMDIKIGRQTWGATASEAKRLWEMKKYADSKREVGFCIPGYQVYELSTGEVVKRGKDHGKNLNKKTVKDTLRHFLNGSSPPGLSRSLVLQLLAKLWKVLRWFRTQTMYRFYASSLLLIYDAAVLDQVARNAKNAINVNGRYKPTIGRQLSLRIATGPLTPGHSDAPAPSTPDSVEDWHSVFDTVCKTHSLVHDYERDLETMKQNYGVVLKDLMGKSELHEEWVNVRMIDFAHAFRSNTDDHDTNYLAGLENLVNIFEQFLLEANF